MTILPEKTMQMMMQTQRQLLRHSSAAAAFFFPSLSPSPFSHYLNLPFRRNNHYPLCSAHKVWLAQLSEELTTTAAAAVPSQEGPIELLPSLNSILAASDDSALQTAASVLVTGAFALFLFRSLRRRAKRAKQTRFRSAGATKSLQEEAIESLKAVSKSPVKSKTPSPDQALLGALIAAAFGVLLYKFTTSIEYTLNHQKLSDNYSVRQITITIRTIINGLCYLATFVFAFNSLGLFLYSGQLAMNSFAEAPSNHGGAQFNSSNSKPRDVDSSGKSSAGEDQAQVKHNDEEQK